MADSVCARLVLTASTSSAR